MAYDIRFENFTFKHTSTRKGNFDHGHLNNEHFHKEYELLYFIKGQGTFYIEQKRYPLLPHQLLVIKPGFYHHLDISTDSDYERVVIRFNANILSPELAADLIKTESIYNIAGFRLENEIEHFDFFYEVIPEKTIQQVFYHQLHIILLMLTTFPKQNIPQIVLHDNDFIKLMSYLDSNILSITSMKDICNAVGMSEAKIQRIMKERMNTSAMKYINTKKCIQASNLIQQGTPVSKVHTLCGYDDYTTFYRNFIRVFGHAPVFSRN